MSNVSTLSELFSQLEYLYRKYQYQISQEGIIKSEDGQEEIAESAEGIKVRISVISQEIQKLKNIKKKEIEIEKLKNQIKKHDERLVELNNVMINAIQTLKKGSNIFKVSSTNKNVTQSNFQPRDLINFTIRINKSFSSPEGLGNFLPAGFLNPYPLEDVEMRSSFLKFNFNESQRLQVPILNPEVKEVKKGTILEIRYPVSDKDVFFRYTISKELIPSFFSGEIYNPTSPIIINSSMTIKVCSCKHGFMDSQIRTLSFETTEEEANDFMMTNMGAEFNTPGAKRPDIDINFGNKGFEPVKITIDDESDSHYTPGSMYQISNYRPEKSYQENDDDW